MYIDREKARRKDGNMISVLLVSGLDLGYFGPRNSLAVTYGRIPCGFYWQEKVVDLPYRSFREDCWRREKSMRYKDFHYLPIPGDSFRWQYSVPKDVEVTHVAFEGLSTELFGDRKREYEALGRLFGDRKFDAICLSVGGDDLR